MIGADVLGAHNSLVQNNIGGRLVDLVLHLFFMLSHRHFNSKLRKLRAKYPVI